MKIVHFSRPRQRFGALRLIAPETRLDNHGLMAAGNFLDVLVSEALSRVDSPCNILPLIPLIVFP